jgi:hypothetical protein
MSPPWFFSATTRSALTRAAKTADGTVAVLPLRDQVGGRETLMSLQIRTDCAGTSPCPLYRNILASLTVEPRWTAQAAR